MLPASLGEREREPRPNEGKRPSDVRGAGASNTFAASSYSSVIARTV